MSSKKVNWAALDKRIRGRRTAWTKDELNALETQLNKLPDLADNAEQLELAQPALLQVEADGTCDDADVALI